MFRGTGGARSGSLNTHPPHPFTHPLSLPPMQALEYQMQQGIAEGTRVDAFLAPASARHSYGPELHAEACVVRLLREL